MPVVLRIGQCARPGARIRQRWDKAPERLSYEYFARCMEHFTQLPITVNHDAVARDDETYRGGVERQPVIHNHGTALYEKLLTQVRSIVAHPISRRHV
jgi:hypothetical protein